MARLQIWVGLNLRVKVILFLKERHIGLSLRHKIHYDAEQGYGKYGYCSACYYNDLERLEKCYCIGIWYASGW